MTAPQRIFPWTVVLLAGAYVLLQTRAPKDQGPYNLQSLGRIPVSADGRVKPLDTVARNSLMVVSDRQTFRIDGKRQPAIRWIADVIARREQANQYPVFRIDHPDVLALMGLSHDDGKRFSFATIMQHREAISQQAQRARQVPAKQRDPYQKHVLELFSHLNLYARLAQMRTPYVVPPLFEGHQWQPFHDAVHAFQRTGVVHPAAASIDSFMSAYGGEDAEGFNRGVQQYRVMLDQRIPHVTRKADHEVFFNHFEPFYHTAILYAVAWVIACLSFLLQCMRQPGAPDHGPPALGRAAVGLLWLTFGLHTFGLVSRVYLQGRPPVTNLYSSAVFVGWGCVLLALIMERMYRLGLGSLTAALIGFVTLIIAHNLAGDGDTMQMMQAVLDSNFWLSTHVVAVTAGYSATYLAGILAILYILLGVFTPAIKPDLGKAIVRMVYGVVCFAALLSFVGTVLGGIWADQSWGRFWGWDPKENGAVLVVLMNVLILHARWGGVVRQRGMMVLAVGGNIVTSWSWFGTNMLGVGLHSYGFMDSAVFWLFLFVASQLVIMGVGLLPLGLWRSFASKAQVASIGASSPSRPMTKAYGLDH